MKVSTRKRIILGFIVILCAATVYAGYQNREYIQQLPIGSAFKAKTLCAAVFVSRREPGVVEQEDIGFSPLFKLFKAKIDRNEKSVTCSLLGIGLFEKKAIHVDKLGAVLLSGVPGESIRQWRPVMPDPEPVDFKAIPWPTGDRMPDGLPPVNIDMAKLKPTVDKLFIEADPKKKLYTRALLIVYDGRLIVERYGSGISQEMALLSWSMAKSVTKCPHRDPCAEE